MWNRRWIDGIRRGDAKAWADLVHANYQRVYRMLANVTRDRHVAEDLCQETFAAAWANIGSFAGDCAIGTWLHRIAYRKFLDARRAKKPLPVPLSPSSMPIDPLTGLVADEEARAVYATLARMGENDRDVLVLHYLQGMSYREMSAVTGEPVGTIKWRTKVALERLSRLLGAERQHHEPARGETTDRAAAGDACAADAAGA